MSEETENNTGDDGVVRSLEPGQGKPAPAGLLLERPAEEEDRAEQDKRRKGFDGEQPRTIGRERLPGEDSVEKAAAHDQERERHECNCIPGRVNSPLPERGHEIADARGTSEETGEYKRRERCENGAQDKEERVRQVSFEEWPEEGERKNYTEKGHKNRPAFQGRDAGWFCPQESRDGDCADGGTKGPDNTDEHQVRRVFYRCNQRDCPDNPGTGKGKNKKCRDRMAPDCVRPRIRHGYTG